MKISVVIPNYNGEKYIRLCLDALYRQTFKDYETIFVDNDSSDDSCSIIEKLYPSVVIIKLNRNYGFSRAVNEGIKASKGEYIVLLNNDTEADCDWLENLVKCIEKDERIFSCCSKMIQFNDRSKIDDAGDEYNILGWAYKRGDNQCVEKYDFDEEVFSSCAGAAIYRKKLLDLIGYFDESFFAYLEDIDISFRARIYGYKNVYCSNARIYHIGSATSGSKYNSFKVKLAARNNVYVVIKNMPLLQLIINSPFLFIGFLIKFIFFIRLGFKSEYKEGFIEAAKNLNKIQRVKFKQRNLLNYFRIESLLFVNTFKYMKLKIFEYFR